MLGLTLMCTLTVMLLVWLAARSNQAVAHADPIDPPVGYPKLTLSTKTVTPTLAHTGGVTLTYTIDIRNTGAYTATGTILSDTIPTGTAYNGDAWSSVAPSPVVTDGVLSWQGDVGFDATVIVTFSVTVAPTLTGIVSNTAVISNPAIAGPVAVTAETIVTDDPILTIAKSSAPPKPGANKPMTYTITVVNLGQPATNLPITVTDRVPLSTTVQDVGDSGFTDGQVVTWTEEVSLDTGEKMEFVFSVLVGDVPSGTVIVNEEYEVANPETGITAGEPYSVTIIDPILLLSKEVAPDPPGSNRGATYTLTLVNVGSLATSLVITDRVPNNVEYVSGGVEAGGIVSWTLSKLDTGESAQFDFTVYVSDIMGIPIVNDDYRACCAEGVCVAGDPLSSPIEGPVFETEAFLDPIAHKPGGGTGTEVTPTLIVANVGNGYAIDATAHLLFGRISVSFNDLYRDPPVGTLYNVGPPCGDKCVSYTWIGSMAPGDVITFSTIEGQSTIGGEEGTHYTATIVITDSLANTTTLPISATLIGTVTHFANVTPIKSAPAVIGAGEILTYVINVYNRGLATQAAPILTDVIPLSTTFQWASDDGVLVPADPEFVSWTLPLLSPGEGVVRSFSVLVDSGLVSGTQIVNNEYSAFGYGNIMTDAVTSGPPVTTTVMEVGLIDSYKEVTPALSLPGPGVVLTFTVHIVNSGPIPLAGVTVEDLLPWQDSTYQRDAVVSAGQLMSDIVSIHWTGDVEPFSEQAMTFTVIVDPYFQGAITNTAVISHPALAAAVVAKAVAYITDQPVLQIVKSDSPDPVVQGSELKYTIRVINVGQQATGLVITDTIPANTEYVAGSATGGGQLVGDQVQWSLAVLTPGESRTLSFRVTALGGDRIVNDDYAVRSAEGAVGIGAPVVTMVVRTTHEFYLPLIMRNY
ncbi:MAG: DUF11 domain-containing protein [Anaerolineae bacterium]|nr:DUF11 domain-containing protein [Anaerolineae bacterium]